MDSQYKLFTFSLCFGPLLQIPLCNVSLLTIWFSVHLLCIFCLRIGVNILHYDIFAYYHLKMTYLLPLGGSKLIHLNFSITLAKSNLNG